MRLNESSMDKLFDLMAMGFKYQLVSCMTPRDLIDITHNHLDVLKRLVQSSPSDYELLTECSRQMEVYEAMSVCELNALRQNLCMFFQDRKVKVSLFLIEHTQKSDGSIVVPCGGTLPPHAPVPGTARYFSDGEEVFRESLPVAGAGEWREWSGQRTTLGTNIYEKERGAEHEQAGQAESGGNLPPLSDPAAGGDRQLPPTISDEAKRAAAVGELNLLASLMGSQPSAGGEHFRLESLFGADIFGSDSAGNGPGDVIHIDGPKASSVHHDSLTAIGRQLDVAGPSPDNAGFGQDDLLDLMDSAAS